MTDTTIDIQDGGQPTRRRARRFDGQASGTGTRSRRPRPGGEDLVASLTAMVDRLIEENRELKRSLSRAERAQGGADLGPATRTLTGLQRRVSRALESARTAAGGRRGAAAPAAPRPRRKVTDPEILERRRQALAKARAARQAKREAAQAAR